MSESKQPERRLCSKCGEGLGFSESDPCDKCMPATTPAPSATCPACNGKKGFRPDGREIGDSPYFVPCSTCKGEGVVKQEASTPSSEGISSIRAIAKDAAENIYNDESVVETESIDNEDTLERWIRIIKYALLAGGVERLEHECLRWQATVDRLEKERDQAKLMNVKVASRLTIAQGKLFETQQEADRLKAEKEAAEQVAVGNEARSDAWHAVVDKCRELGLTMHEAPTGLGSVLKFIEQLVGDTRQQSFYDMRRRWERAEQELATARQELENLRGAR